MNTKQLIAAVALVAVYGAVYAEETESVNPTANFVSTKTRAQVYEELKQAQADGTYVTGGTEDHQVRMDMLARRHRMVGEPTDVARDSKPQSAASGS